MHGTHWLTRRFPLKTKRNQAYLDLKRVETDRAWGRVRLLELGSEAKRRWRSRGGRPTAPEWSIRRLVPFEEALWLQIKAYARTVGLTPGQVAALLIERGSRGLAWMGGREARFPETPPRAPGTTLASEPPPGTPEPPTDGRPRWPESASTRFRLTRFRHELTRASRVDPVTTPATARTTSSHPAAATVPDDG